MKPYIAFLTGLMAGVVTMAMFLVVAFSIVDTNPPQQSQCPAGYTVFFRPGKLNVVTQGKLSGGDYQCFRPQDAFPPKDK